MRILLNAKPIYQFFYLKISIFKCKTIEYEPASKMTLLRNNDLLNFFYLS
jgi:hypothetical protein